MRIAILYATAGCGHMRAAQALAAAARQRTDCTHVVVLNVLDYAPAWYRAVYERGILWLAGDLPWLWSRLYRLTYDRRPSRLRRWLRAVWYRRLYRRLPGAMALAAPDVVLATHYSGPGILAAHSIRPAVVASVVTDHDVHAFWVDEPIDHYCVGSDLSADMLACRGVDPGRVSVTGIPVDPVFGALPSPQEARRDLNWPADTPTVLLMSGGHGLGPLDRVVAEICRQFEGDPLEHLHMVVIAGRNLSLRERIRRLPTPDGFRLTTCGFVDNVHTMMAASDLAVGKAGGLFTSECLAAGLPAFIPMVIPGHEAVNADYLEQIGAAVVDVEEENWEPRILDTLRNRKALRRMAEAASRISLPNAASAVLYRCADLLEAVEEGVAGAPARG